MPTVRSKESGARDEIASQFFLDTLADYRDIVLERIQELIPQAGRYQGSLYGPMLDYPLREGKGFRAVLCLKVCQACGGSLRECLDSATALELFHNAFLIHDDIEDDSESRRGKPTLHTQHGIASATNIGDALNMLALQALLGNTGLIGLERSLAVVEEVSRMARETTEGQSVELDWVRGRCVPTGLRDYLLMTYKKTTWYTCIAPMRIGALIADVPPEMLGTFIPFGYRIGAAFQIQDDLLNLVGEEQLYGKETNGDIAEGKRTLMIIHAMATADRATARKLRSIYAKPRRRKRASDIAYVLDAMQDADSLDYARGIAARLTASAKTLFETRFRWIPAGPHRRFIEEMIRYMIDRRF